MDNLYIETVRLMISEFDESMVQAVHENSLDDDNRRFVPDEVFETVETACETVQFLMACYNGDSGPYVYPVLLRSGENIGYVQAVPIDSDEWEIGYHIAKRYTGNGYVTEAVAAFLPIVMGRRTAWAGGSQRPSAFKDFSHNSNQVVEKIIRVSK